MNINDYELNKVRSVCSHSTAVAHGSVCRVVLLLIIFLACRSGSGAAWSQQKEARLLTYEEAVSLYRQASVPEELQAKLGGLLATPFVSNQATSRGVRPLLPHAPKLGRVLRVVQWNIERGLEYDAVESSFTNAARFSKLIDSSQYPRGSSKRKLILEQVELMKQADVIILNEVDWGLKRTGYRNVAADLASALGMNYAYGVEFVEVDPIALGIEQFEELPPADRAALAKDIKVDPARYKGLHGTAILSRLPLENVRLHRFEHQPHDWYAAELDKVKPLEKGRRKAGELIFREKVIREVRRGGRMMLMAEIVNPAIPGGRATVVATHLESKTKPSGRRRQLRELLARIKGIDHPVIVAGDMNTTTEDSTPTSIQREFRKRLGSKNFWLKQGLQFLTGVKLPGLLTSGLNTYRKHADPTVSSIPLVASNPEAEFFEDLKDFRTDSGGAFDFRGERGRSMEDKTATLANSNQRGDKGFITTYEAERTIGFVGRYKLDWIFVVPPGLNDPDATGQPHRFAPHFGRTLKSLNYGIKDRVSDHDPIIVDLPLD
jgi:endonuclease/exonuclease/phosphatase family metal-dependent hydrolase